MTVNEWLRAIAGMFVLASVALGHLGHPGFYLFTAFVGLEPAAVGVHAAGAR